MTSTRLETFLPFHRPWIGEEEIAEVVDTLRSGWLTLGPKTQRFEEKFAQYIGAKHAVAVASCTAALHLILESLGVGPGDEVITSPYTFASTVTSILYTGATPVLVDTLPEWPNVDPALVARKVSARTKVILPVHFAGAPCDMTELARIAERAGATLADDAAHALPASHGGRRIGTLAKATAFSFYAGKNMTTGEGGMVTTDDGALADELRMRRLHGISRDAWKRYTAEGSWYYEVAMKGFKYNMTDINAALGLVQLRRLGEMQAERRRVVTAYQALLRDVDELELPSTRGDVDHAWHLFVVRVRPERLRIGRDDVIRELTAAGIGSSVHFIPLHELSFYREHLGARAADVPVAAREWQRVISLPLYPTLSDASVERIAETLRSIVRRHRR